MGDTISLYQVIIVSPGLLLFTAATMNMDLLLVNISF